MNILNKNIMNDWSKNLHQSQCGSCYNNRYSTDPRNFAYIFKYDERYDPFKDTGNAPQTNNVSINSTSQSKFLGLVTDNCISYLDDKIPNLTNGVTYTLMRKDAGSNTYLLDTNRPGPKNEGWGCGSLTNPNHAGGSATHQNYYVRNWAKDLNVDAAGIEGYRTSAECCSGKYDNQQNLDPITNTLQPRERFCPNELYFPSSKCVNVMHSYCSNDDPTTYKDLWLNKGSVETSTCGRYIISAKPHQQQNSDAVFLTALDKWSKYVAKNGPSTTDPFIKVIKYFCNNGFEGKCQAYLNTACKNITKARLEQDVDANGDLTKICACHLRPTEYSLASVVPIECNSSCQYVSSNNDGVGLYTFNTDGGVNKKHCVQPTCLIDNLTLKMMKSSVGDVNFSQVCSGTGNVSCVMDGIDVSVYSSTVDGNINFSQNCSGCSVISEDGSSSCSKAASGVGSSPVKVLKNQWQEITKFLKKHWKIIGVITIVIILIFVMIYYGTKSYSRFKMPKVLLKT